MRHWIVLSKIVTTVLMCILPSIPIELGVILMVIFQPLSVKLFLKKLLTILYRVMLNVRMLVPQTMTMNLEVLPLILQSPHMTLKICKLS